MKKSFKSLVLFIAMAMLFVAMAVTAGAEAWGDYTYEICEDGTAVITGYNGASTDLVIPDEIDGIKVTAIKNNTCHNITSIVLPDSIESIGRHAFSHCATLKSIDIGDGVTSIGEYAFYKCYSLEEIIIGKSLKQIEKEAFEVKYN